MLTAEITANSSITFKKSYYF